MLILTARPAPPSLDRHVARPYLDRATRLAITDSLADEYAATGRVTPDMVAEVAYMSDRSHKSARRMLREWELDQAGLLDPIPDRRPHEALLIAIAEAEGNVALGLRHHY